MKLKTISKKRELIDIIIDDEATIKEYGEPLEFKTWDRHPIDTFMKLTAINKDTDPVIMIELLRPLILDDEGNSIMIDDVTLPIMILIKAIAKIAATMGNQ